jgi:hypothetical protein
MVEIISFEVQKFIKFLKYLNQFASKEDIEYQLEHDSVSEYYTKTGCGNVILKGDRSG